MADDENLEYFEDEEEEDTKQIANNYNEGQEDFMNDNDIEKEIQNELEEMKENKDDLIQEDESDDDSKSDKRFPVEEPNDWIHWFCKLKGNEYFVEIDEDFLKNKENLTGIKCNKFMKTLLSEKPSPTIKELTREIIEDLSELREVYGLIHKRFINTPLGLGLIREKFLDGVYGYCPRILCNKQVLLPVGLSEDMRYSQVKVFCPLCQEVYKPTDIFYGEQIGKKLYKFDLPDGVFFGTSFPQTFLLHFPDLDPRITNNEKYIPKLYGFRIFGKYGSKYYTKDQNELDKKLIELGIKKA
jgi:casein kinase II subunit beta